MRTKKRDIRIRDDKGTRKERKKRGRYWQMMAREQEEMAKGKILAREDKGKDKRK